MVIMYRGFHADGASLLPDYVNGMQEKVGTSGSTSLLQREFVKMVRRCNGNVTKELSSLSPLKELHLKQVTVLVVVVSGAE